MAHSLILGMTESGKTTLAKRIARELQRRGFGCLILDPLHDPEWIEKPELVFQTSDSEEFLSAFWESKQCYAFIDEGGESAGRYDTAMTRTATRGRHWGHSCFYITQKGTQLAPLIRDNCSKLFLFTTALEDCKIHAREWNKPELKNAAMLDQGEYFKTGRYGALEKFSLFK